MKPEAVERTLKEAPESCRGILARAFDGTGNKRNAIKAFCLTCVGYERKEVTNCSAGACPLWKYRPFQPKEGA